MEGRYVDVAWGSSGEHRYLSKYFDRDTNSILSISFLDLDVAQTRCQTKDDVTHSIHPTISMLLEDSELFKARTNRYFQLMERGIGYPFLS